MSDWTGYLVWLPTTMLVIFRIAGIFLTAPILSNSVIPMQVRALMSVVIGLAVTARLPQPVPLPGEWVWLVLAVGAQTLIGAAIGYAVSLLFMGVELGAEQISQQMGITLGSVFNPLLEDTTNVLGVLFHMTALAIFLAIGGHRLMLLGLLKTFDLVPLTGAPAGADMLAAVLGMLNAAFILSIKLAAPAVLAIFLATLAMVFIQRTMPQLNILSAGFQVRVMLALLVMVASLMVLIPLLERGWSVTTEHLARMLG